MNECEPEIKYGNSAIADFVLRAKIYESVRNEDPSLQEPVIEVP